MICKSNKFLAISLMKGKKMKNFDNELIDTQDKRNWKNSNQQYLKEVQKFLDIAENIKDEQLKKQIIHQMLICDEKLTMIAEKTFLEK